MRSPGIDPGGLRGPVAPFCGPYTLAAPRGPVSHRVRIYHNILHTCRPDYRDPLRTHGDVAEFYDEAGRFMGLAVYMGQGLYCPLLAPGRKLILHPPSKIPPILTLPAGSGF